MLKSKNILFLKIMRFTFTNAVTTLVASNLMLSIGALPAEDPQGIDVKFRIRAGIERNYRCAGGYDRPGERVPIDFGAQMPEEDKEFCASHDSLFTLQADGKLFFREDPVGFTTVNPDEPDLKYETLTRQEEASSRFKLSDDGKKLLITTRDNQCVIATGGTLRAGSCDTDPSFIIEQ